MKLILPLLILLFWTAFSATLAQTDAGALRVLVQDATGAVIPGAEVTLTNEATNVFAAAVTNNDGYAGFVPVRRGVYTVLVSFAGFNEVRVSNVVIEVNERRMLPVVVEVAAVSETIDVVAGVATIQTEEGSLGQIVRGDVAVELPLAARRYTELALLTPGVAASTMNPVTRGPGWFVSNGNYHTQNNFVLDGFDNNQGTQNAQSLSAQVVQPSPDAIGEFKVQTNSFSAEFGRSAGAVVNVSIKSGANDVRGSAWYYNRDASLAANSWRSNLIGAPRDDLAWHQFGGTLGGPIVRDRLFYFGAYEGFRRSFSDTFLVNVPTMDQRAGTFNFNVIDPLTGQPFPERTIPSDRFDPLGKKLVDLYPAPNLPGRASSGGRIIENFGVQRGASEDTHKFDIRSDYDAGPFDRFFFRYSFLQQDLFRDAIFEGPADGEGNQGEQYNRNQSFGAAWTRTFSPNTVNELRFGYNRTHSRFAHATAGGVTGTDFGFVGIPAHLDDVGGLPLIDMSNYQNLGTRRFRPQFQDPVAFQLLNTLSRVRGAHSLRAGFELRIKSNELVDVNRRTPHYAFQGQFTGDAVSDLLIGYPQYLRAGTVPVIDLRQQAWSGFVQNDWKLRPDLTLNLGLRYEYTSPYYGAAPHRNVNFDFATRELLFASDSDKYLVAPDRNNFGPRLGLAWQVRPRTMVFRAGYGVFYSGEDMRGSEGIMALNVPNLIDVTLPRIGSGPPPVRLSDRFPEGLLDSYNPATVTLKVRDRDHRSATIHQWNLALQFLLPRDSHFEAAYVGNRGSNLLAGFAANQVDFGLDGSIPANRPFPEWAQIESYVTATRSNYNAFQAKLEKRYTKGWYLLTSYTYASALDEAGAWGAGSSPQIRDNFRLERGPQSQVPRHRLSLANVWQVPFGRGRRHGVDLNRLADAVLGGWQISNIVTLHSGLPVNVGLAGNGEDPHTGERYRFLSRNGGSLRPDRVGNPNTGVDPKRDRFNFLDPNAFRVQPVDTPGNSSRNPALGPGFATVDMSLVKRFGITENSYADFRVEAFNLFNRVNFRNPNATFGGSGFGVINNSFDPRIMQLALRFAF